MREIKHIVLVGFQNKIATFTILNMVIVRFENSEDLDQLASWKPADQDQHCFPFHLFELIL